MSSKWKNLRAIFRYDILENHLERQIIFITIISVFQTEWKKEINTGAWPREGHVGGLVSLKRGIVRRQFSGGLTCFIHHGKEALTVFLSQTIFQGSFYNNRPWKIEIVLLDQIVDLCTTLKDKDNVLWVGMFIIQYKRFKFSRLRVPQ